MIHAKPGDEMTAIWGWTGGPRTAVLKVVRLTPKQVVAIDQHGTTRRFWRHSGRGVGGDMGRLVTAEQAEQEVHAFHAKRAQEAAATYDGPIPIDPQQRHRRIHEHHDRENRKVVAEAIERQRRPED